MRRFLAYSLFLIPFSFLFAAQVGLDWQASETMPAKVARPFCGFVPSGEFLVAGGSDFVDGKKVYRDDFFVRGTDGVWKNVGKFPRPIAEAACCETPVGIFGAGGTDGSSVYDHAAILTADGQRRRLANLPEPVKMGAAACDGKKGYVVASKNVYAIELENGAAWTKIAELPGEPREQHVAAILNGANNEKQLVVYGGFEVDSHMPLPDGYAFCLSAVQPSTSNLQPRKIADLPPQVTTIGAAFLASDDRHVLLTGGFGWHGWIDRACKGSKVADPVRLGWQRKIWEYDAAADSWREHGEIASNDSPRCGAAAGLRKTSGKCELILAGGEIAPMLRTDAVSVAHLGNAGEPASFPWLPVAIGLAVCVFFCSLFVRKRAAD